MVWVNAIDFASTLHISKKAMQCIRFISLQAACNSIAPKMLFPQPNTTTHSHPQAKKHKQWNSHSQLSVIMSRDWTTTLLICWKVFTKPSRSGGTSCKSRSDKKWNFALSVFFPPRARRILHSAEKSRAICDSLSARPTYLYLSNAQLTTVFPAG